MQGQGTLRLRVDRGADQRLGGKVARLSVTDTGPGMSEEVRARIFEPFFTTKRPGQGTGLGLATVYGIAAALGGRVAVEGAPGAGATVQVLFPLMSTGQVPAPVGPPPPARAPHGLTVFVVDDEPPVRQQMVRILTAAGFTVRDFACAEEVLAATARRPGQRRQPSWPERHGAGGAVARAAGPPARGAGVGLRAGSRGRLPVARAWRAVPREALRARGGGEGHGAERGSAGLTPSHGPSAVRRTTSVKVSRQNVKVSTVVSTYSSSPGHWTCANSTCSAITTG